MNSGFDIDLVFKALGDPTRRRILDILKNRPGISMNEITEEFDISRFGVRKHMLLLEEANLISFQWERPVKRFFLNAVPIQMITDRWIAEYSKSPAARLTQLKYDLEELNMSDTTSAFDQVHVVYIRTTAEKLWQALTESKFTQEYYMGCSIESDLKPGSPLRYTHDGALRVSGKIVACEPHKKFAHTFHPILPDGQAGPETNVEYTIEEMGENIKLTVKHTNISSEELFQHTNAGWSVVLSGLKSVLETGSGLKMSM